MSEQTPPKPKPLTPQQEKFCNAYVIDGIAKKAAIEAGYSPRYAAQTAYKILSRPRIAARVEELRTDLADRTRATAENIIERYRRMSMLDPTCLLTLDDDRSSEGKPVYRAKRPDELSNIEKGMLADVTLTERTLKDGTVVQTFKYKVHNGKDALDSLARTHGMFRDKIEHEHSHKIQALFEFVAKNPARSETVAMLDAKHGRGMMVDGQANEIKSGM